MRRWGITGKGNLCTTCHQSRRQRRPVHSTQLADSVRSGHSGPLGAAGSQSFGGLWADQRPAEVTAGGSITRFSAIGDQTRGTIIAPSVDEIETSCLPKPLT